jgi:hypothetical protein
VTRPGEERRTYSDSTGRSARLGLVAPVVLLAVIGILVLRLTGGGADTDAPRPTDRGDDPHRERALRPSSGSSPARRGGSEGHRPTTRHQSGAGRAAATPQRVARHFVAAWMNRSPGPGRGRAERRELVALSTDALARHLNGFAPPASATSEGRVFDLLVLASEPDAAKVLVTTRERVLEAGAREAGSSSYAPYLLRLDRTVHGYAVAGFEPQI